MLNLAMFESIRKVPGALPAPVTRAEVMAKFPIKLSKTNQRPYSKKALAAVEAALKAAKKIKHCDLKKVMADGELRMGPMGVSTGIALLRLIGAVTSERYKINGKMLGVVYSYIEK